MVSKKFSPSGLKSKAVVLEFPGNLVVKDPALSLLWCRFNPWPRISTCHGQDQKRKKKSSGLFILKFLLKYQTCRKLENPQITVTQLQQISVFCQFGSSVLLFCTCLVKKILNIEFLIANSTNFLIVIVYGK